MNTPDEPHATPLRPAGSGGRGRSLLARWPVLGGLAAFLLLAGLVLVVAALVNRDSRPLYPALPTFTPVAATLEGEAAVLTFTELNKDPDAFRDRRIQVAGNFAAATQPGCIPYNGPPVRWTLVAEELQLNAIGFENLLGLIPEGTPMTVTGIWRLYRGPVGCGKEPPDANVWYLAVDQILEPNPLLGPGAGQLTVVAGTPLATLPPLDLEAPTVEATPALTTTLAATSPAVLPTIGATSTLPTNATATLSTPALTGTVGATGTVTPSGTAATPGTATPTGTPTPTATPGPSPTPSATNEGGSGGDDTPGIPTATLSGTGYPGDGYP